MEKIYDLYCFHYGLYNNSNELFDLNQNANKEKFNQSIDVGKTNVKPLVQINLILIKLKNNQIQIHLQPYWNNYNLRDLLLKFGWR